MKDFKAPRYLDEERREREKAWHPGLDFAEKKKKEREKNPGLLLAVLIQETIKPESGHL